MNKFLTKIAGVVASIAMVIGVGVGVVNKQAQGAYASTAQKTSFTATSGSIDSNIEYAAYRGGGTSTPAINSSAIRLYQGSDTNAGGMLVVKTSSSFSISSITVGSTMATTIGYVVGEEYTETQTCATFTANEDQRSVTAGGTTTISGISTTVVTLACLGTSSSSRWYLNNISVTYSSASTEPSIAFSEEEITGEEGEEFSFTYDDANLTSPISWSPASNATDIINYEVDTVNKTVSGTLLKAGEVTLTATSGDATDSVDFVVTKHQNHRKYTIQDKNTVSASGDTMTGASASYSQTYGTASQATSGNSMTLTITGLTKKVSISKLVLSMHSNSDKGAGSVSVKVDGGVESFIAGTSSSAGAGFNTFGDNDSYGSSYRDVTWSGLTYLAKQSIVIKIYCIATNSLYCESFDIFFAEQDNTDVVTAFSVSPNTWSGYDSQTLNVNSFTPSITTNGEPGTSNDYTFLGIGYMDNETFVARDANFTSGHPTVADTRLCWKANYPTTVGGSTYLFAYVTLTVAADGVSSVAVSGDMNDTDYLNTEEWDKTGLVVTAHYASNYDDVVTNSATIKFYRDSAMTEEVATPAALGAGEDQTIYIKGTYQGVSNTTAYEQTVTVTIEHGTVQNDPLSADDAIVIGATLAKNKETTKVYYVQGVVTDVEDNQLGAAHNNATFVLYNENDDWDFKAYRVTPDAGCTNYDKLLPGAEVLIRCNIKNYNNELIENGSTGTLLSISYVTPVLSQITLSKTSLNLKFGESETLTASPFPIGAELGEVTWSSSNTKVATVNQSGEVTAVGEGSATITARSEDITGTCTITVTPISSNQMFKASSIAVGDVVILAAEKDTAKKQLNAVDGIGTVTDYSTSPDVSVAPLTVEAGSQNGTFALKLGTKYLSWTSGNSLTTSDEINDNSSWTITFNGTTPTIKNVKDDTRKLQYNASQPRFACYTTSQTSVILWKVLSISNHLSTATSYSVLEGNETNEGVDSVTIRFGARISEEKWNAINADWPITDYGVMLRQKAKLGGYDSLTEAYNDGNRDFTTVSKGSGTAPTDYSFYARISFSSSEKYNLTVCAVPFIVAGGHCYLLTEQEFSVVTLAQYHQQHGGSSLSPAALAILAGAN